MIGRPLIRALRPDDDRAYRSLWREALCEYGPFFRTALEDPAPPGIPTRQTKDSFTLGAFDKEALVGIVSLERDIGAKLQHKGLLFRLFVTPRAGGRGIGKSIVQEALDRAEALHDLRAIHLTVLEKNHRARGLYESLGFVDFSLEPEAVCIEGNYVGEIRMVRFLRR